MVLVTAEQTTFGQFFSVLKNNSNYNPLGGRGIGTRVVEGTGTGMTFTPEVSSIERYLTIPLDFCPALYSINALMGVAEGVDEEKGETWRTSWAMCRWKILFGKFC